MTGGYPAPTGLVLWGAAIPRASRLAFGRRLPWAYPIAALQASRAQTEMLVLGMLDARLRPQASKPQTAFVPIRVDSWLAILCASLATLAVHPLPSSLLPHPRALWAGPGSGKRRLTGME